LAPSRLRNFSHTICFVPAGRRFEGWQIPLLRSKSTYFRIDPDWPLLDPEMQLAAAEVMPQLQVDAAGIEGTALKLKALIGQRTPGVKLYAEALGLVLQYELLRLVSMADRTHRPKGGLAPWQEKRVRNYLEDNLAFDVTLTTIAKLVGLSTSHFAHAFKHSFGVPPHRYFALRRVERAKSLLAAPGSSVTEIALALGFSGTSAFTTAFHKATGLTPSDYRRENR
jgi:AraC family transcriptional regulator